MPLIIAHRTLPLDAPENSRQGVRAAATLAADAVEVDVRLTRDGVPVLLHDPLAVRTAWWPLPVAWCSSRWVSRWRLRGTNETVPTLAEVLAIARGAGIQVAIDTKAAGAAPAVLATVQAAGMADRVLLWSQHAAAVRHYAQHGRGTDVALLRDALTDDAEAQMLADAASLGATAVSVHQSRLTPQLIERCHQRGLRVHCWFQDERTQHAKGGLPLDGIVTDWPVAARALSGGNPGQ